MTMFGPRSRAAQRFCKLPRDEIQLTAEAAALLSMCAAALRVLPSRVVMRWVFAAARGKGVNASPRPSDADSDALAAEARRVATVVRAVHRADRRVPGGTCLTRAFVAWALCRRCGISSQLRVGVAMPQRNQLASHAWLEWRGQAVIGGEVAEQFVMIPLDGAR